jgi:hypothetical protein
MPRTGIYVINLGLQFLLRKRSHVEAFKPDDLVVQLAFVRDLHNSTFCCVFRLRVLSFQPILFFLQEASDLFY